MSDKIHIRRILDKWGVTCDVCEGINFLSAFMPWAVAVNHPTAIVLAEWHAREHQARYCEHCNRTTELPRLKLLDKTHVEFDGQVYEIRASGVVPLTAEVSK